MQSHQYSTPGSLLPRYSTTLATLARRVSLTYAAAASGFLAYLLRTFRKCFIYNSSHDLSMPSHFHFRLSLVNFCALRRILWPLVNIIWVEQFIKVAIDEDAGRVLASNCCNLCDDRRPFGNDLLTALAQAAIWQLQTDFMSNCQETCAYCCAKLYTVPVKSNVT